MAAVAANIFHLSLPSLKAVDLADSGIDEEIWIILLFQISPVHAFVVQGIAIVELQMLSVRRRQFRD